MNQAENLNAENQDTKKKPTLTEEIFDWLKYILAALVIAFLINNFIIVNAVVPTESMVSTIMPKDRLVASRLHYYFTKPKRGDIVVFRYPDDEKMLFVKRVIGLPGETVEIKDNHVYINGKEIDEPYLQQSTNGTFGPYTVPSGHYFMLGDNRSNSKDSRYWENKYVAANKILGKVLFKYYKGFEYLADN